MKNKNKKGFTLIELLVVVAIIGILAAVGVTAFGGFQESAKKKSMQAIHASVVKVIAAELKKCTLGETTFMTGTNRSGSTYSRPCTTNTSTLASYAVQGIEQIAKDKNPWQTASWAVRRTSSWGKGYSSVYNSGKTIYVRSCWDDSCSGANRQQDSIIAE